MQINLHCMLCERVDWIHLAQCRIQWRTVMNAVMKLTVPQTAGYFLTS
jgi:hypothetical protein